MSLSDEVLPVKLYFGSLTFRFIFVQVRYVRFRHLCNMCKRFHSCLQFDPFFDGLIAICASWIHMHLVQFIFEALHLLFGGSIYF